MIAVSMKNGFDVKCFGNPESTMEIQGIIILISSGGRSGNGISSLFMESKCCMLVVVKVG